MAASGALLSSTQSSAYGSNCQADNIVEESEANALPTRRNCRVPRLRDLDTRSDLPLPNDADDPDQLSDSSSPWSTSSEMGNLCHVLDVRGNTLPKAETGFRAMSRRSIQQVTKENMLAELSSSLCLETGRLNSTTLNVGSAMGHGLENCSRDIHQKKCYVQKSDEIKSFIQYINAHDGQEAEIGAILKPFIPNYILAVGVTDEFIKVVRPDKKPDHLGLKVLDESGAKQSNPAMMMLQLFATSHQPSRHVLEVASIENVRKNSKSLDAWINNIKELHCTKPSCCVIYSKVMPDVKKLLQEWPTELGKVLAENEQPTTKLDVDLATFVDICCSILDIPVYKSRVESLHVMFSLYVELKNNPHRCFCACCKWKSEHLHSFS